MNSNRIIYFDEKSHKYINDANIEYISVTTYLHKFEPIFDSLSIAQSCAKIGQNPNHPKYSKYRGMSVQQILDKWNTDKENGLNIGNEKHNYIDNRIKQSNNYNLHPTGGGRLFTILDIKLNPSVGQLNLEYFNKTGLYNRYPRIYNIIKYFVDQGYTVYSEIGVFNDDYGISGLIDLLLVKGNKFILLDWKTNKDGIPSVPGYFQELNGVRSFIQTDTRFLSPINSLPYSIKDKYTLQTSMYSRLVEFFDFELEAIILCHIGKDLYIHTDKEVKEHPDLLNKERTTLIELSYLKQEIDLLLAYKLASTN